MNNRNTITSLCALAVGASSLCAFAGETPDFQLDWFTFDSGGGTSTGGVFTIDATIGQPDPGPASGGDFTMEGGFIPGTPPAPCFGDLNGDDLVDSTDLNLVLVEFGCAAGCNADLDGDGDVDSTDLNLLLTAFGDPCE